MPSVTRSFLAGQSFRIATATLCVMLFAPGNHAVAQAVHAQTPAEKTAATEGDAPKISNDQLDSLVAPIALYPDPLLAQTLAASTYPLEVIQLQQWMDKNKNLKGKALTDAVAKQPWDPSIQSMAALPDVVGRLAGNIQWTADLGNAFLDQQQDVMDAVQRMRAKAQSKGSLKTSQEQKVESKQVEGKTVVVIEQANPETVYVPSYDPAVVYGPPVYPYYPYTYPGYYPGMGLAFGTGILIGAGIANGWWGNCNWGGGDININNNNNFNRNQINNRPANGNKWQHNVNHRGAAPYSNRKTAEKFGGNDRRGPNNNRSAGDRNRPSTQPSNRPGTDRASGNRPGTDRSSANRSTNNRSSANRPTTRPSTTRPSTTRTGPSGADRISSNRSVSRSPSSRSSSAFSNGGGFSRSSASSSFSRGSSSMGSRGGPRGGGRRR